MNRRVHFLFAGVCTLAASAAYGAAGCSSSSGGSPAGATDAGEADTSLDTGRGFDAAESDSGSAPVDSAPPAEAAADSSVPAPEAGLPESGPESGAEGGVDAAPEASDAAAPADASEGGTACTDDLSNIGTADFTIAFSLSTSQTAANVAVLNQRSACTFSMLWDVRVSGGNLYVATDDNSGDYNNLTSAAAVNDGSLHAIVVKRVSEVLSITVDGTASGSGPSTAAFGALPPLQQGTDVCEATDGTVALVGTLANVCISSPGQDAGAPDGG